jgi:putative ABC transport system permease protein
VDLGFAQENLIKVQVTPAPGFDLTLEARLELFDRLRARLVSVPGVRGIAHGSDALLQDAFMRMEKIQMSDGIFSEAAGSYVSDDFLQTAGMSLIRGRWLNGAGRRMEVVINERLARARFGEQNPLGQLITIKVKTEQTYEVVGVIRDVRETLRESVGLHVYCANWMTYNPAAFNTLILRADQPTGVNFGDLIRRKIYEFEPRLIVDRVSTISETINESLWAERFAFTILKGLAGIALGLAVVGLFAVIAHTVDSRTKEFGVRLALGAEQGDLHRLVMKRGIATAALGVGVGILGALGLTRFMQSLLFETTPNEPVVYLVVAAFLLVAAAVACWLPARRAAKVDPVVALRAD